MSLTPLTVAEARAVLRADEALDATYPMREEASGHLLSSEETNAWIHLVKSAHDRIAAYEGTKPEAPKAPAAEPYPGGNAPDFQTLFCEAMAEGGKRGRK